METMDAGMAKNFITKLLKEENVVALRSGEKMLEDLAVHVSQLNLAHRHHLFVLLMVSSSHYVSHMFVTRVGFQSCPSLELLSTLHVTHLPLVWDLLLPLA